jgi:cell division protein FtsB
VPSRIEIDLSWSRFPVLKCGRMNRSTPPAAPLRSRRAVRSGGSRTGMALSSVGSEAQSGWFEQAGRVVLFVVAALGIAHVTALILMSGYRHSLRSQQSVVASDRISALTSEVRELEVRAAKARSDRQYLEELARHQGFVRKSERVLVPFAPGAGMPVEDPAPTVPLVPSAAGR